MTRKQSHSSPKSFFDRMIGENAQEKREEKAAAQEAASYSGILTIQPKRSGEAESHITGTLFFGALVDSFAKSAAAHNNQPRYLTDETPLSLASTAIHRLSSASLKRRG